MCGNVEVVRWGEEKEMVKVVGGVGVGTKGVLVLTEVVQRVDIVNVDLRSERVLLIDTHVVLGLQHVQVLIPIRSTPQLGHRLGILNNLHHRLRSLLKRFELRGSLVSKLSKVGFRIDLRLLVQLLNVIDHVGSSNEVISCISLAVIMDLLSLSELLSWEDGRFRKMVEQRDGQMAVQMGDQFLSHQLPVLPAPSNTYLGEVVLCHDDDRELLGEVVYNLNNTQPTAVTDTKGSFIKSGIAENAGNVAQCIGYTVLYMSGVHLSTRSWLCFMFEVGVIYASFYNFLANCTAALGRRRETPNAVRHVNNTTLPAWCIAASGMGTR